MRPRFHPRLINGPFEDPGLYISFLFEKRAIIFDLGDTLPLAARDLLKVSHAFITHTHVDHFIGFDRVLRIALGREKKLHLYGPRGFLKNTEGKLAAYSWNLVKNYPYRLGLHLTEVHHDYLLTREYLCQNEFIPMHKAVRAPFNDVMHEEPAFKISAAILDHGIPCLGLAIKERFHVNINKDKLVEMELKTGPWLNGFKQALYEGRDAESEFEVQSGTGETRQFRLGELSERIALITPGQKIAYIADAAYSPQNQEKIVSLAKDADQLFIEAAFLEAHKDIAAAKHHLTARQAGTLAARAGAKEFTIFHFSPRYVGQEHLLQEEAREAYALHR
ncbi:MAG: MBL fold metallo-hydrolase [Desulfobacterales bacterium]|jgi:ribonuclease Z